MKLSFSSLGCPEWPLERIAEKAKAYGYDGVELRVHADGKHLTPAETPEALRRAAALFRGAGVPIAALSGYAEYSASDPSRIREHADLTRTLVAMASALGAGLVRVYGGTGAKGENLDAIAERAVAALRPLAREASAKGVRLAIETHDAWTRGADLVKILRAVDSPGLAVCFDVHNTLHVHHEWKETYAILKPYIGYCHIKDGCPTIREGNPLVMVGAGEFPLRDVLRQLKGDGYAGFLSFEWEKRWCPDLEPPERALPPYVGVMRRAWESV